MDKLAIIGGTGVYDPQILDEVSPVHVSTPYGDVDAVEGSYKGRTVVFMNRHGAGHSIPPHLINYRANIWALKSLDVERILATSAVGTINTDFKPGHLVFPDQYIEFTKARKSTFFEGGEMGVVHTDMTTPYCPSLRRLLVKKAVELGLNYHDGAVYVATEGPRFETPAEIKMYKQLGGDLVGMTSYPEVALAKELGMCYATVSMVTNFAAGISKEPLSHQEVLDAMASNGAALKALLFAVVPELETDEDCLCRKNQEASVGSLIK